MTTMALSSTLTYRTKIMAVTLWRHLTLLYKMLKFGSNLYYCISSQGRNHVFKVGGPIPWSWVLLPFYRKNRQVYPVWYSRLHNHTLFINKLCKKLRVHANFGEVRTPRPPSGCAHVNSFMDTVFVGGAGGSNGAVTPIHKEQGS